MLLYPQRIIHFIEILHKLVNFSETRQEYQCWVFCIFPECVQSFYDITQDHCSNSHSWFSNAWFQNSSLYIRSLSEEIFVLACEFNSFVWLDVLDQFIHVHFFDLKTPCINFNNISRVFSFFHWHFHQSIWFVLYPFIFIILQLLLGIPCIKFSRSPASLLFKFSLCLFFFISFLCTFICIDILDSLHWRFAKVIRKQICVESCWH